MNRHPVATSPQALHPAQGAELLPCCALTVHTHQAQHLHILQGRVWLTLDGAGAPGDHFLAAGESLLLPAGTRAVMEAYPAQPVRWASVPLRQPQAALGVLQAFVRWAVVVRAVFTAGLSADVRAASAASSASLAQGSISPGDSRASGGGVM
jgi:hypothetical protein